MEIDGITKRPGTIIMIMVWLVILLEGDRGVPNMGIPLYHANIMIDQRFRGASPL